jgi:hypothetical protein
VVRREAFEKPQSGTDDVEGSVPIEQALPALSADDRSETEIAISRLFFR